MSAGSSIGIERRSDEPEVVGSSPIPAYLMMKVVTWGQRLGRLECPYARRWVLNLGVCSLRVHHFYRSDDKRYFHDHPWWYITLVLWGSYTDVSPGGDVLLRLGSIATRRAEHQHTVVVGPRGVWTLLLTGPEKRKWGFWVNGKWLRARRYFFKYGHHPCDQP